METAKAIKKAKLLAEDGRRMVARAAVIMTAIETWERASGTFRAAEKRHPLGTLEYMTALSAFNRAGQEYREAIQELQPKKFVWPLD